MINAQKNICQKSQTPYQDTSKGDQHGRIFITGRMRPYIWQLQMNVKKRTTRRDMLSMVGNRPVIAKLKRIRRADGRV